MAKTKTPAHRAVEQIRAGGSRRIEPEAPARPAAKAGSKTPAAAGAGGRSDDEKEAGK